MGFAENIQKAKDLVAIGMWVFPAYVKDTENPYKKSKRPATPNGFLDATNDPFLVEDLFEKHPKADVAVWAGASGVEFVDIDVHRAPDGTVKVDGFDNFERSFLDLPETFGFESVSKSGGMQYIYVPPEGRNLGPSSDYRGIRGLDIRAGGSWSVWPSDVPVPESREVFAPAPEWALDEKKSKEKAEYTGEVQEWFDSLEPGPPSPPVRKAMDRARAIFERQGDDFSHSDLVERQYEAVRLGAEGQSGVQELLDLLEELTLTRTGSHTRTPEEYAAEFQEALDSGIRKAGETIELRKNLPEYSLSRVPEAIPDSLVTGQPGGKSEVMKLAAELAENHVPTMDALSILWGSSVTRDLTRDWGLEFTHKILLDAQARVETPEVKVEMRDDPEKAQKKSDQVSLLTDRERGTIAETSTFIDQFHSDFLQTNGFAQSAFTVPLAWTVLSMAAGRQGVIPKAGGIGTNLWFAVVGPSGTGKTIHTKYAEQVIDGLLGGHETYWGVGSGSPEGIGEALVRRDGLPSALFEDEAGGFYKNLVSKDWMQSLQNQMADWYTGVARAPQKVRLAELRGKKSHISFNYFTISTPDDTFRVLDEGMFATGFMARMSWIFGPPREDTDERYRAKRNNLTKAGRPRTVSEMVIDLTLFQGAPLSNQRTEVWGTDQAIHRLEKAYKAMDQKARNHPKYDQVIQPSVVRLDETMWKCAALLAMFRGSDEFDIEDALIAISYVESWYANLLRVSEEVAGAYMRDANVMLDYIRSSGGKIARTNLVKTFGHQIVRTRSELADRIDYLVESGQLRRTAEDGKTIYEIAE